MIKRSELSLFCFNSIIIISFDTFKNLFTILISLSMKIHFILLYLIFISLNAFSQEKMFVPFRVGSKFGLSDLNGNLVYPAEFEYVKTENLGNSDARFIGIKEGSSTFFYKGKKIVERSKDAKYEIVRESFVTVSEENKGFEIFNFKGEQITDKSYEELVFCDNILQRNFYYTCTPFIIRDQEDNLTLLVFNEETKKITKTIIENVCSLTLDLSDNLYKNQFTFFVKEKINSQKVKLQFIFDGDSFVILDPTNYFKKNTQNNPKKGKPIILEENDEDNMENYQEFGVQAPLEYVGRDVEYRDYSKDDFRVFNKVSGSCITIVQKNDNTSKETEIELTQYIESFKFQNVNVKLFDRNARIFINDIILYKSKGKYGAVLTDKYYLSPIYDSIRLLVFDENSSKPTYYFQVGIKDSISNKMKFGLVDLSGKVIKSIVFDVFRTMFDSPENDYKFTCSLPFDAEFIVAQKDKYGVISLNGQKAPLIYDDIFSMDSKNCVLVKSGLYGIYFQDRRLANLNIIEPVFTKIPFINHKSLVMPIIELYDVNNSTNDSSDLSLTEIQNRIGNFFCYGNINGMMYYREK